MLSPSLASLRSGELIVLRSTGGAGSTFGLKAILLSPSLASPSLASLRSGYALKGPM